MDNQNNNESAQPDSLNTPSPQTTIQPNSADKPAIPQYNEPKGTIDLRPKRSKKKILLILLAILLLAVGGWFAYKKLTEDKAAAPVAQSKDIEQLNVGVIDPDYGELYPKIEVNSYSYMTNSQIFEGLVRYEGKSKIVPLLAKDWSNPDSTTWVFNLKSGVAFHNGNTMNAEDVKYSIEKVKASGSDFAETFTSTIASVKAVNDSQVEIKTSESDPALLNRLSFVYIIDNEAADNSDLSAAGTGPYTVKSGTQPTTDSVQLTAYDSYHGGKPKTKAVNFGSEPDADSLIKAYNEGKYNIIGAVPTDKARNATAAQFVSSEPEVTFLGLNTVKPGPLQKKEVREAIRYAVDPEALGKVEGDQITPLNQLIPESIPGYNPAIEAYRRDTSKSRQLLTAAGYPNGLTLRLSYASDQTVGDELARQLKEANITLQLDRHDDFNEFIDYFSAGNAEMYYITYSSDILDSLDMFQSTLPAEYYNNPELNNILQKADQSANPADRLKLLQEGAVIVDKDVAAIPLITQDSLWLMDKDYEIVQDMPSSYLSVYFYKVQMK